MEASSIVALTAVLLAFAAGSLLCSSAYMRAELHGLSVGSLSFEGGAVAWVLRNGIRPLNGASRFLLRSRGFAAITEELAELLREKSRVVSVEALGSIVLAALLFAAAFSYLVSSSAVCVVAVLTCVLLALLGFARTAKERREAAFREEVPDVIRSLIVCFGAGMTLGQAAEHLTTEFGGPIKVMFEDLVRTLEMGGSAEEALQHLKGEGSSAELAFVAVALDVQHRTGGGIIPILESAKEAAQEEVELRRAMRVQTAQARLSARIVTIMPFILIALFSLMSEGFLEPFFESVAGFALLCVALIMQVAGVIVVRQMLKVS